jgi:hypothetical protein
MRFLRQMKFSRLDEFRSLHAQPKCRCCSCGGGRSDLSKRARDARGVPNVAGFHGCRREALRRRAAGGGCGRIEAFLDGGGAQSAAPVPCRILRGHVLGSAQRCRDSCLKTSMSRGPRTGCSTPSRPMPSHCRFHVECVANRSGLGVPVLAKQPMKPLPNGLGRDPGLRALAEALLPGRDGPRCSASGSALALTRALHDRLLHCSPRCTEIASNVRSSSQIRFGLPGRSRRC